MRFGPDQGGPTRPAGMGLPPEGGVMGKELRVRNIPHGSELTDEEIEEHAAVTADAIRSLLRHEKRKSTDVSV